MEGVLDSYQLGADYGEGRLGDCAEPMTTRDPRTERSWRVGKGGWYVQDELQKIQENQ